MKTRSNSFVAMLAAGALALASNSVAFAQGGGKGMGPEPFHAHGPKFTDDGQLVRPEGWRKWVYVGTPLTPHDMNDGKASFPEFHNVYVDPESFATFERTGEFPNGTQLLKELVLVGSKAAVSGNGYFMGDFAGLEVAVKDTVRFKDEPGGWAYFSFGHVEESKYTKTAKAFPAESCNSCHESSADTDFVFTQYYPILRAAMPKEKQMSADKARMEKKKLDSKALSAAMGAMGESSADVKQDDYANKVFEWLKKGGYKRYKAESAVHPSSTGAVHGDVRTYVNDKLDCSMMSGAKEHPVGSASIKELYKDGKLYGWAAAIKAKSGAKANGWYWYEVLSTTDNSNPVAASLGSAKCAGCHSVGTDFIRTNAIK